MSIGKVRLRSGHKLKICHLSLLHRREQLVILKRPSLCYLGGAAAVVFSYISLIALSIDLNDDVGGSLLDELMPGGAWLE